MQLLPVACGFFRNGVEVGGGDDDAQVPEIERGFAENSGFSGGRFGEKANRDQEIRGNVGNSTHYPEFSFSFKRSPSDGDVDARDRTV